MNETLESHSGPAWKDPQYSRAMRTTLFDSASLSVYDYRCTAGPGTKPFPETHLRHSLSYVRRGSFGCRAQGREYDLVVGALMVGRPGLEYTATHEHHPCGDECLSVKLSAELVESFSKNQTLWDVARVPPARIFHCGSSSHIRPAAQQALRSAVRAARGRGVTVSFDPNVRAHLWRDLRELRALCDDVVPLCDVVKLSEDEVEPCLGVRDPASALDRLHALGVQLACVTLGARGAMARRGNETAQVPAPQVEVVDTTGAGDGFLAALLASDPLRSPLSATLRFACAVGSRVCTRLGAVAGLPSRSEAESLRDTR